MKVIGLFYIILVSENLGKKKIKNKVNTKLNRMSRLIGSKAG